MTVPRIEGEAEVLSLRTRISELRSELTTLEERYKQQLDIFQQHCGRQGHDYKVESDDDYHNTRNYYVCKRCDYFTRYK